MRILVLNNYSLTRVLQEVNRGEKPAHHLYGIDKLIRDGFNIIFIEDKQERVPSILNNFFSKLPLMKISNISIQLKALWRYKEYDLVYAPCQDCTSLLGFLAYFGLFRKRVIAIAHHPMVTGRLAKLRKLSLYFSIIGHYQFAALSKPVGLEIESISRYKRSSKILRWGPDIDFYRKKDSVNTEEKKYDFIVIGRTGRDNETFVKGLHKTSAKALVFAHIREKTVLQNWESEGIKIQYLETEEALSYVEIIKFYNQSKVIAIPMPFQTSLCGLTSVTDAIAMKMPVLISKNAVMPIDPELYDFGKWINNGDTDHWAESIDWVLNHQDRLAEWGTNAYQCAVSMYNSDNFYMQLLMIIKGSLYN
jgi:glycosyltransferase involved in cell wall biosynthesis